MKTIVDSLAIHVIKVIELLQIINRFYQKSCVRMSKTVNFIIYYNYYYYFSITFIFTKNGNGGFLPETAEPQ